MPVCVSTVQPGPPSGPSGHAFLASFWALSVQKRICAVTQRRARQERLDPNQSVRPRELDVAGFLQQDKTGMTQMCKTINPALNKLLSEVYAAEEAEDE